jgi:hypothetical protein
MKASEMVERLRETMDGLMTGKITPEQARAIATVAGKQIGFIQATINAYRYIPKHLGEGGEIPPLIV